MLWRRNAGLWDLVEAQFTAQFISRCAPQPQFLRAFEVGELGARPGSLTNDWSLLLRERGPQVNSRLLPFVQVCLLVMWPRSGRTVTNSQRRFCGCAHRIVEFPLFTFRALSLRSWSRSWVVQIVGDYSSKAPSPALPQQLGRGLITLTCRGRASGKHRSWEMMGALWRWHAQRSASTIRISFHGVPRFRNSNAAAANCIGNKVTIRTAIG